MYYSVVFIAYVLKKKWIIETTFTFNQIIVDLLVLCTYQYLSIVSMSCAVSIRTIPKNSENWIQIWRWKWNVASKSSFYLHKCVTTWGDTVKTTCILQKKTFFLCVPPFSYARIVFLRKITLLYLDGPYIKKQNSLKSKIKHRVRIMAEKLHRSWKLHISQDQRENRLQAVDYRCERFHLK